MLRDIGWPEIILILVVVVLLFGAKRLPELARGSGRALRIFKAETKGLVDGDDETEDTGASVPEALPRTSSEAVPPVAAPTAEERARFEAYYQERRAQEMGTPGRPAEAAAEHQPEPQQRPTD